MNIKIINNDKEPRLVHSRNNLFGTTAIIFHPSKS